ncbi:aldehyde:ferredoxin oxidoreductase [Desulfacinum infernum DSM 9756]|uniref:Aldehyde:ferredoxin oxidoreductase n=1 Tax=Desulfacinum infernum DSM 9756 TaxID=1121391 RepID=A0A1M5G7F4_9BACT|nr:aldehyde ferredoxin oxidoreductase C-terminal domain-containing protein [Desulfacinum infernum]SHF99391.1 aldehyde:ferredoxin oxidoreductase [Desulfacinum infernum DSM 9756]
MRFIRIDMKERSIREDAVPPEYQGLGGRGLIAACLNREVPPRCHALGSENKLVISPGILSGTPFVNTSRLSLGAKSPLTGGIKESNVGGTPADLLGRHGVQALVVEGRPESGSWMLLHIDRSGQVALRECDHLAGMGTYETASTLKSEYGEDCTVLCIGPAGERLYAIASVQATDTDGRPCRAAGRGGMGAVMGSKGLKAVVIEPPDEDRVQIADPGGFRKAVAEVVRIIKSDPMNSEVMPELGTAALVAPVNAMGAFPCYNARKGVFEGWEKISGEALAELLKKRGGKPRHTGCSRCIIHCSNEFVDESGAYVTSSLEYETIWAMGGMLGVDDLDTIARLDFMCDDLGVDTMNAGVGMAVAMDSGHAPFGDREAVFRMMEDMARGTGLGPVLGAGPVAVGRHFNNPRVPAVKGQSIAAYDPRAMLGQGVTYATSPMGADHTAGNMVGAYLTNQLNPRDKAGQVEVSRELQIAFAAFDTLGLCFIAAVSFLKPDSCASFAKAVGAKMGCEFGVEDFRQMGMSVLRAEREFNRRAGLLSRDDRLPKFFYEEPLPPTNAVFTLSDQELDSVFEELNES